VRHPIQPIEKDKNGTLRFKENAIVRHILDNGGVDLNQLAGIEFSDEDRQQFAQLIGYSLCGFGDLSYVNNSAYNAADNMYKLGLDERDARIIHLEKLIGNLKKKLRMPMAKLFEIHPDDLK